MNYMKHIILFLFLTMIAGCSEQAGFLRSYSREQEEQQAYVQVLGQGFKRLQQDIASNTLQAGISKQECVLRYADPIACAPLVDVSRPEIVEECLYAEPQQRIPRRFIRLYFDAQQKLLFWRLFDDQL